MHELPQLKKTVAERLRGGAVIPAHPLALNSRRKLDERRQRALTRYYLAAGAGGLAVGVHTTQFAIRDPRIGLFQPVLELAAETIDAFERSVKQPPIVRIAGICGQTRQAVREAQIAADLGYHLGLLGFAAFPGADTQSLTAHARAVAEAIPLMGFYLQPSVGGRVLPYEFWREFAAIENAAAVKIAPFDRYRTLDVVRAVMESDRREQIALYTGNDDHIVGDLLAAYEMPGKPQPRSARFVGGLLGHWAVWTRCAYDYWRECRRAASDRRLPIPESLLALANQVTDANAAFFDARNDFAGCIPGIHEVLRRQGLLEGVWCLDENEVLSAGQSDEIDRVHAAYPHLDDTLFVAEHLDEWLR